MVDKIRILIADDHPAFRSGLSRCLREEQDIEVIGEASDGEQAIELARQLQPDVILIDVNMPRLNGIEAAKKIKDVCPNVSILVISAFSLQSYIVDSIRSGVSGYLLKTVSMPEIAGSIRLVHTGHTVFDVEAATGAMNRLVNRDETGQVLAKREMEILKLAAKGLSNKEIAAKLAVSERTVQTHLGAVFKKLGVGSRTGAVLLALKEGLITVDDLPNNS